jgi:hypothetical protein
MNLMTIDTVLLTNFLSDNVDFLKANCHEEDNG